MADKFSYITNDDLQNNFICGLQLVVETLHLMNQSIEIQ